MLRLRHQDTSNTGTLLEQTANMVDLVGVHFYVTGEREIEDPTVGKARDALDEQVKHLTCKGL
jgi:hypothetical protein